MTPSTKILDHIVHLTPPGTLEEASEQFRKLEFNTERHHSVIPGGTHAGGLTANTLIILPDGTYLELIAFTHPAEHYPPGTPERTARDPPLSSVINGRAEKEGSQVRYTAEVDGGRKREDGEVLEWVITAPKDWGDQIGGSKLPFFCGDVTPRGLRVPTSPPSNTQHSNGTKSVAHLRVLSPSTSFDELSSSICSITGDPPIVISSTEHTWFLDSLPGAGGNGGSHTRLVITVPKEGDHKEIGFVETHGAGIYEIGFRNPTLQAIYPLSSTLTILRTLNTTLTPQQNITSFGTSGTVYAQLWYAGVEQFYCTASSCQQSVPGNGSSSWQCHDLACTCRPNTTFCGAVPLTNLTSTINGLSGDLDIACDAPSSENNTATCSFRQSVLENLFGSNGLSLSSCSFGECVRQDVIDTNSGSGTSAEAGSGGKQLSGGVIAGLVVVGALLAIAVFALIVGWLSRRRARKFGKGYAKEGKRHGGVIVEWNDVSYVVQGASRQSWLGRLRRRRQAVAEATPDGEKVVLDGLSGKVEPGQMMGILGPSGAGKTTLVEILANKHKSGITTGLVHFPQSSSSSNNLRIGFVPQQDVLPPILTVFESLLFAARLRLPEHISDSEKRQRVEDVVEQLGLSQIRDVRIGGRGIGGVEGRGISGGEMRRVSIGLELVASPDVLILDEPTSGLDSVSASKVASVLRALSHDPENPIAVIASIHQPSSQLYQTFDQILLLSRGRALYCGPGSFAPVLHFSAQGVVYRHGYNVADHLLEIASDMPLVYQQSMAQGSQERNAIEVQVKKVEVQQIDVEQGNGIGRDLQQRMEHGRMGGWRSVVKGGLYFQTNETIAGFQSRIGCLFFLGSLIAFSSLSALYNIVEVRPLFLRERSNLYYNPTAWLLSRFIFDVVPLRIIPTIIVSTITYWMAGLAPHPASFFKFLFILVLYTLVMTLFNFLLATLFRNGGLAILLSALTALYQMTYAGFFVHLNDIPPVLRWLQWLCPLKYTLEALSVNEVGSGLMIRDTLQGVPVDVSASLIMNLLFGFGANNYYRDVLVLFAFIAGFAIGLIGVVWIKAERDTRLFAIVV
ncbi:hypothetical protein EW146_g1242 [Bondarzewia mesenterica]|uniref:ABC transporter domain-containing protein n=1 Tax=Bondarzewia mesenterica TaxID=1095465 RepID=A0A4S4M4H7_9AGAM|nr:hypothetical protein EW146_g1242 [Bondarzewia mesenterica]